MYTGNRSCQVSRRSHEFDEFNDFATSWDSIGKIDADNLVTDINFRLIYEDNRSFPNDADVQSKFKIFNLGVEFR